MKHLYLLPIYLLFISSPLRAQIGIHGDVTLKDNSTAGFFGPLSLVDGIVESETDASATVYLSSDFSWDTANHNSYIGTRAHVENHSELIFPIGDGGTFHPLAIHNAAQSEVTAWYQNITHTNNTFAPNIESKANFYWKVEASAPVRLSLTWGPESALSQLTNALEALIFLGFNGNRWEIIPAQARAQDLLNLEASSISLGTMTSDESVDLSNYEAITIGARVYRKGVNISDAFSPNGDGSNDTWFIQYAPQYPNMKIQVFNRWGEKVYSATAGYNNDWGGNFQTNKTKLPSSSYFYQIDLENDGKIDHQGWVFIQH